MQFRRNGLRDERRRRALMDDRASDSGNQSPSNSTDDTVCRSARSYSKTAVDERRIRIVDVVPVYLVHVTFIYSAILFTVAVLLAMHHYGANIVRWADLTRVDSLGTYLSAGALFVGALLAFLTYRIRRHRLDDYRGRYRCWLWFAGLLLLASLDCMLNFRSDVARGLEAVTRVRLLGQTDGWWIVVWCVAYGSMTLRALIEVRESFGTIAVGLISATLLFIGMALQMDLLLLPSSVPSGLALHAAQLLGVGLLLATLVQYSRFVWLDAQGLISRRQVRVQAEADEEAKPKKPARRTRTTAKKPAAKSTSGETTDEDQEEAKPRRGWFSFGKNKSDATEEEETTKTAKKPARPAAKSNDEEDTQDEKPRRGWFSFGKKKKEETEEEVAKPVKKPVKPAAKSTDEEAADEEKPRRGWFSFGKKRGEEDLAESEVKAPAKPKIAASTVDQEPEEEKPKRSWFSWGKKSSDDIDQEDADAHERTTMTPRVKTRPKQQSAAPERPAASQVPTITGKYSDDDDLANSAEDEEILRLKAKPEHLLSKAERRRLKKLKRRAAA